MTDTTQPEALRLADWVESVVGGPHAKQCAAELRRQHAELETLRTGYAAARLEIESLKVQIAERASHGQAPAQPAPAAVAGPVAVLRFERGIPGRENEMPRVVSCNWMPDGEYEVYLAAAPTTQPAPKQDPSQTAVQLAELVLSDCGRSSRYAPLLNRVTARINAHVERRLDELRGCLESRPSPVAQGDALDAARLDWLRDNSCDLRCVDSATGQGDGDIHWIVIEHHMTAPVEREIGRAYRDDPRAAIDAARAAHQEGEAP